MLIALVCYATALFIPSTKPGALGLRADPNIFGSTWRSIVELVPDRRIWIGTQAVSWFWLVGAVTLSLVPVLIKQRIGGGLDVEAAISAFLLSSLKSRLSRMVFRMPAWLARRSASMASS